jgi:hypothetical protein
MSHSNLSSIYRRFYAFLTSVDPDHLAHLCCLIWICFGHILIRNNRMNLKADSVDPDLLAHTIRRHDCAGIWIYTVRPCSKVGVCLNSVDPDQPAHPCRLIAVRFKSLSISDQEANIVDQDQIAQMCWLNWIYTGHT